MKKAVTFLEILIVVIIIAIIVAFAMPGYFGARSRALDKEAQSQLKLIQAAEKIYRLEVGFYVDCDNNTECNDVMNIDLPADTASDGNWNYAVVVDSISEFTANATGGSGTQDWAIDESDEKARTP